MRQVWVHGRGEQGVRLACRVLAGAFVRSGWRAWAIGGRGDESAGTPVNALVQVDDDAATVTDLIVLDPALFDAAPRANIPPNGVVLVAGTVVPCGRAPKAADFDAIDAPAIAELCGLGPDVGTTMAGAFAGITGLLALDTLEAVIAETGLLHPGAHLAACRAGYRAAAQPRSYHMAS